MAKARSIGSYSDQDFDRIIERMRQNIPDTPYFLSVPSEHPYRILDPVLRDQWRTDTWFEPHQEHLQYSTFIWRDPSRSLFQLNTFPEQEAHNASKPRQEAAPSPGGAPKKKISLAAYKNKSRMMASQTPEAAQLSQDSGPISSPSGPPATAREGSHAPAATSQGSKHSLQSTSQHVEGRATTKQNPTEAKLKAPEKQDEQSRTAEINVPWLPNTHNNELHDSLPPRLSPLFAEGSILSVPSPGALQRHALLSLSGSSTTPVQIKLGFPSSFETSCSKQAERNGFSPGARLQAAEVSANSGGRRPSLIVVLRTPSLKKARSQKRKSEDESTDESNAKRGRYQRQHANGDILVSASRSIKENVNGLSSTSAQSRIKPTATEWQAEAIKFSRLGKRSKVNSSDTFKQSEQATDNKEQVRLRRAAAVQALESLLLFLQSFVAKAQCSPKLQTLLADWISFLPYSSNVVAMTRHFVHLEGLGLLLQSVASSQIVRICSSIRQQQQQDEAESNNDERKPREAGNVLQTLHKHSNYAQQKALESDKRLSRKTLAENYPKAYAVSLDQALGMGLLPMPTFRMAVQILEEWTGIYSVSWQRLEEGLCRTL